MRSEVSARLPSVIAGVGTLILIYLLAVPVIGRLGALLASVMPLGFYFFIARGGRECATDAPLIFFSTLAIYAVSRARDRRSWLLLSGVACGLAILSKGLAGVLPLSVAAIALAVIPGFSAAGLGAMAMDNHGSCVGSGSLVYLRGICSTIRLFFPVSSATRPCAGLPAISKTTKWVGVPAVYVRQGIAPSVAADFAIDRAPGRARCARV